MEQVKMEQLKDLSRIVWRCNNDGIIGLIELKLLNYVERIHLLKKLNLEIVDGETRIKSDTLDQLIIAKETLDKCVQLVDIEIDGTRFDSWDNLQYSNRFQDVLNQLMSIVFNGAKLSSP